MNGFFTFVSSHSHHPADTHTGDSGLNQRSYQGFQLLGGFIRHITVLIGFCAAKKVIFASPIGVKRKYIDPCQLVGIGGEEIDDFLIVMGAIIEVRNDGQMDSHVDITRNQMIDILKDGVKGPTDRLSVLCGIHGFNIDNEKINGFQKWTDDLKISETAGFHGHMGPTGFQLAGQFEAKIRE